MAPTAPSKRRSIRARAAASTGPKPVPASSSSFYPSSPNIKTKKAKRLAKHTALISRIHRTAPSQQQQQQQQQQQPRPRRRLLGLEPSSSLPNPPAAPKGGIQKRRPTQKTRRPSKKLIANLSSLASALPSLTNDGDDDDQPSTSATTRLEDRRKNPAAAGKKILLSLRQTSLRSRPGALKRKEKVARWEMKEFGRNMAASLLLQGQGMETGGEPPTTSPEEAGTATQASNERQPEGPGGGAAAAAASASASQSGSTATPSRWAELRKQISSSMDLD